MAESAKDSEKRQDRRVKFHARVDYEIQSDDAFVYEYMTNLSKGGIFLSTLTPLEVGTMTKLRFDIPSENRTIEVKGKVAWVNSYRKDGENPNPGMGIEFIGLSKKDKESITQLVKRKAILPK